MAGEERRLTGEGRLASGGDERTQRAALFGFMSNTSSVSSPRYEGRSTERRPSSGTWCAALFGFMSNTSSVSSPRYEGRSTERLLERYLASSIVWLYEQYQLS